MKPTTEQLAEVAEHIRQAWPTLFADEAAGAAVAAFEAIAPLVLEAAAREVEACGNGSGFIGGDLARLDWAVSRIRALALQPDEPSKGA